MAAARGLARFVVAENEYSILCREAEEDVIPSLERNGVGLLAHWPLARGLLSGKYAAASGAEGLAAGGRTSPATTGRGSRRSRRSAGGVAGRCSRLRSAASWPSRD